MNQCNSCGGFCPKSGCLRENDTPMVLVQRDLLERAADTINQFNDYAGHQKVPPRSVALALTDELRTAAREGKE